MRLSFLGIDLIRPPEDLRFRPDGASLWKTTWVIWDGMIHRGNCRGIVEASVRILANAALH
jgi:hypothetical protein